MNNDLIVFMPSIEGGGVEKNLFLVCNHLVRHVGSLKVITISKKYFCIISSTATTLAAFLPLIFWPGLAGEFMKYLPITLICVLTSSLFMALLFVPVLGTVLNNLARIFLQLIIPLVSALIVFNLISYGSGFNTINYLSIPLTIIKFLR